LALGLLLRCWAELGCSRGHRRTETTET
jgi:hypothetical protein